MQTTAKLLVAINTLLAEFGGLSGFTINVEKSTLMELNISDEVKRQIMQVSTAVWKRVIDANLVYMFQWI